MDNTVFHREMMLNGHQNVCCKPVKTAKMPVYIASIARAIHLSYGKTHFTTKQHPQA
jgi:hypothetical protein